MNSTGFGQHRVDRTPAFEKGLRKKHPRRENQVLSKSGIIRPDKRKAQKKYL